jgi:rhodanese-related sulfurtransferase
MTDHSKTRKTYKDITLPHMKALQSLPGTVVVDVREPWEFDEFNEGGINIPLSTIRENRNQLTGYETIIVICTNGTRSKVAALDYCRIPAWADKTIYHLQGGILEAE